MPVHADLLPKFGFPGADRCILPQARLGDPERERTHSSWPSLRTSLNQLGCAKNGTIGLSQPKVRPQLFDTSRDIPWRYFSFQNYRHPTTNAAPLALAAWKICLGMNGCGSSALAGRLSPATMKMNFAAVAAFRTPVPGMGLIPLEPAV
jgi:hypothetical protein